MRFDVKSMFDDANKQFEARRRPGEKVPFEKWIGMALAGMFKRFGLAVSAELATLEKRIAEHEIVEIEFEQSVDDPRTVVRTEVLRDGRRFSHTLRFDVPLFAGTYGPNKAYSRGDMVVRGGTTWICVAQRAQSEPGNEGGAELGEWMVAARRGKDGKDADRRLPRAGDEE